jgi:chitin disaccharide deacetylase
MKRRERLPVAAPDMRLAMPRIGPQPLVSRAARVPRVLASILLAVATMAANADIPGRVFLTFDDGPIDATLDVLDVLKQKGIKASFFVNAIHLEGAGGEREGRAGEALRRVVEEGHMLGNHSHDHMGHNRPPGVYAIGAAQAYRDVETDLGYFLPGNVTPVNAALGPLAARPNNCIGSIARLPFSNVWMLPGLSHLCQWCDSGDGPFWHPASRANPMREVSEAGGELARLMLDRHQVASVGWDIHWMPRDWTSPNTNETLPPASAIETEIVAMLEQDRRVGAVPVRGKQVIVLTHDFLFEDGPRGHGMANLSELAKLIDSLRARGYAFDTIDHYLQAGPSSGGAERLSALKSAGTAAARIRADNAGDD